jgi:hypothetical protein
MGQILHGSARTTEAVRRAIQHSQESLGTVGNFVREAGYRHQMTNRSPKITANWVFASAHSRGGRFHS